MKNVFYLIFMGIFFFAGCVTTYTSKDFSTNEKFYEDFNKSAKDKSVKITLTNDSSFTALYVSSIFDDTLVAVVNKKTIKHKIFLREIKNIKYYNKGVDNLSADIILLNGKKLNGENIRVLPDSSLLFSVIKATTSFIPIYKVKQASYKNHLLGSASLLGLGFVTGAFIGIADLMVEPTSFLLESPVIGAGSGIILGSIIGGIVGYTYIYQFNP